MTSYRFDPLLDSRWDSLVQSHPRASVFHTTGWLRALQRTYGYQPTAFTTSRPDEQLENAAVVCLVKSWATGERLVSLPFSDHCDVLANDVATEQQLIASVLERASQNRQYLELRPRSSGMPSNFAPGPSYLLHALDVRPGEDRLLAGFHKDCVRRKIQRAEREGLSYEEGHCDRLLTQFSRLLLLTRRRHKLPPQPASWYLNLRETMGDSLKIRVAWKSGEPVASILTLRFRDTLVYKYGCSNPAFNSSGGMIFLLWRAIQEAVRAGLREVDLGRSDRDNLGLVTFKDRWGAQRTDLNYWCYPASKASSLKPSGWKQRVAGQVFRRMPDALLAACGRLLYRHIG